VACEDRADERIAACAVVKRAHEALDHRCVDAGALNDIGDDQVAARCASLRIRTHSYFPALICILQNLGSRTSGARRPVAIAVWLPHA
jgi:hypothetical protein